MGEIGYDAALRAWSGAAGGAWRLQVGQAPRSGAKTRIGNADRRVADSGAGTGDDRWTEAVDAVVGAGRLPERGTAGHRALVRRIGERWAAGTGAGPPEGAWGERMETSLLHSGRGRVPLPDRGVWAHGGGRDAVGAYVFAPLAPGVCLVLYDPDVWRPRGEGACVRLGLGEEVLLTAMAVRGSEASLVCTDGAWSFTRHVADRPDVYETPIRVPGLEAHARGREALEPRETARRR